MERKEFLQSILALTAMGTLSSFKNFTDALPSQGKKMPVLFTSHGNPMDIPVSRSERAFWQKLYDLGITLQKSHEVKAALVVSAHWCTKGTFVNISPEQKQIYDYYGFPEEYYKVYYKAKGSPDIAREVKKIVPSVSETTDWGLDHGAWPMLKHMFPKADVPVFEMSIDYYQSAQYHFDLAKQLKPLRDKGVLVIGSGAVVHNIKEAGKRFFNGNMTPYGWDIEFDKWIKQQLDKRDVQSIVNYEKQKLGLMAAPTPDHYVPLIYSLALMDENENIEHTFEELLPAFSNRGFRIG
ncbi:dioxygenase [Sediminibacterium sp. C3]|uniref:dioxygenase family protein n=1 Tax=Sediminibacterium sp. C3 TaxID=1267211 RepID=UPI0003F54FA1|nr:class III extradiol ring-cleavage dioxygenase [Sediminibacterium sp. C3]